jgi:hypothetical protein
MISSTPASVAVAPEQPGMQATHQASQQAVQQASNIAILQFSGDQVSFLREPAFKAQTFRFTDRELEWLKEQSYQMSKNVKRGKVSQADIIRVGLQLFANAQAVDTSSLLDILQRIK